MHLLTRNILTHSLKFINPIRYRFVTAQNFDFNKLTDDFKREKDMVVFHQLIKASNNTIDNIYYFKIYKFLADSNTEVKHFQDLFMQVNVTVQKKSDNIRMLLANIKSTVAKKHQKAQNYYDALNCLEDALDVLESSLIPPILLYYQIYRYYGTIQYKLNKRDLAREALEQSVRTIEKFVEQSEDHVTSSNNSKNQAFAYCLLADLDPKNQEQWIKKCFESWEEYEDDRTKLKEYADSVLMKGKILYSQNKEKGLEFLIANIYQFKEGPIKDYLKEQKDKIIESK